MAPISKTLCIFLDVISFLFSFPSILNGKASFRFVLLLQFTILITLLGILTDTVLKKNYIISSFSLKKYITNSVIIYLSIILTTMAIIVLIIDHTSGP